MPVASLVLLVLLTLLAACGRDTTVRADRVTSSGEGYQATVLVDERALSAVSATFTPYLTRLPGVVTAGAGSAADIATTVKHGQRMDVVILPAGPALDRVRGELILPPSPIGSLDGTEYWAGAVTARGLPFVTFLTTGRGAKVLQAQGLAMPTVPSPMLQ
jgi:hypothetical protein